ncbi:MAG TPA: GatB/YqeY domain-containing protein [Candidatus Cloacimonadota bacterium]|jgi:uncharacterized protein YqeY|nr:GatB/YqeY domain-containing protein [Candidatus Cloacimonadales bacterium]HPY95978.1 GatB/YqeY domain-containing protein [Candidatus Cloacimonadota bacterium]HQB40584.1 GatB/YqeY domain-containing protein [Candidatus Cloacimonadota bacterium]
MDQIKKRRKEILGYLNRENDFYLITLLENMGEGFTPEELLEAKLKFDENLKKDAIHQVVLDTKIPMTDRKALSEVSKELNNMIERNAVFESLGRNDLVAKTEEDIIIMEKYLSECLGKRFKLKSFPTSQSRLYDAVRQAIGRSIKKIKKKDKALAEELKNRKKMSPKVHLTEI